MSAGRQNAVKLVAGVKPELTPYSLLLRAAAILVMRAAPAKVEPLAGRGRAGGGWFAVMFTFMPSFVFVAAP